MQTSEILHNKKRRLQLVCLFFILGTFLVTTTVFLHPALASRDSADKFTVKSEYLPVQAQVTYPQYENTVYIGIWLNNIYSFQYTTGDYTFDFYLYFFWVDPNPNITQINWQLVNGYPINPTAITLINRNLSGQVKHEIYRVTARFNTPPDASDYPFDLIKLKLSIDLLTHGYYTDALWLENQTGLDLGFKNPGWTTSSLGLTVSKHAYPLDLEVPRAEMLITQQRQRPLSSIQSFIPPIIFGIVSTFSFLFGLKEMGTVGLRIGLNTSMLVTTLLFGFTASAGIPPSSTITIYSLFLLSVLIFMVINVNVTIVGIVAWGRFKNERQVKRINRWGFLLAISLPVILFLSLYFLRA